MSKIFFRPKFQSFLFFINNPSCAIASAGKNNEERIETSLHRDTLGEMRYRAQRLTRDIWFRFAAHKFAFVSLQQTSDIADTLSEIYFILPSYYYKKTYG
jgi:hypothetical protein